LVLEGACSGGVLSRYFSGPMRSERQTPSTDSPRQCWAGLAVLLAVAMSTGFAPSAMAWALVPGALIPGVDRVLLAPRSEPGNDRAAARQIQDAIAKAVRDFLKGTSLDGAITRTERAATPALFGRASAARAASVVRGRCRSQTPIGGRLAQPPPTH
jgi:hypothetical protein